MRTKCSLILVSVLSLSLLVFLLLMVGLVVQPMNNDDYTSFGVHDDHDQGHSYWQDDGHADLFGTHLDPSRELDADDPQQNTSWADWDTDKW
jgi:hypothetical protein